MNHCSAGARSISDLREVVSMNILVAYDGTVHAKTALRYGLGKAAPSQGNVVLLQVFDRAAFIDYEGGPNAEVLARGEAREQLREAEAIIASAKGVTSRIVSEEGDPEERIRYHAEAGKAELVLVPPRYKAVRKSLSCPVYIIPGTLLVPVDHTESGFGHRMRIADEVRATRSRLVLLGVVPVHLYSREEKAELATVRKRTEERVLSLARDLSGAGIESTQVIRSGYPDEEILRAADEFSATLILIPSGDEPSELTKAAAVIGGEPERMPPPILFLSPAAVS